LSLILAVSCAIGIAATWLLLGPSYEVSGAIRVDPVVSNIITGQENGGGISNYTNFVATQAIQDELVLTKKMQDAISRRIQEFKMERKRPARISVACKADITETHDIRGHYTVALLIGFLVFGILSLLLQKR